MSKKDVPIIFVPDATYLTEEGLLFAKFANVIADSVTYFKIKNILEDKGKMTDDSEGKYRIGSPPAEA